ncbi:esterase [Cystobacter fuscus]|uniref:Esterase n=1 Tax=Cystobacter fuscus TaxID=43 RepID=A0A250JK06_9BACT|nr:alpha/beta hydrolase [Cystobacter fuscus]ATB43731.1 esterase [Cystobacter fuscus]AYM53258.1 alpha/beta hydrolase [Cystobacter fuscus]
MALDPELVAIAHALPPTDLRDVAALRASTAELLSRLPRPPTTGVLIEDILLEAEKELPPLRIRMYGPERAGSHAPAILWLHSGGFVAGSIEAEDAPCLALASAVGARVFSVDYRLAPEHPFPAALDDAERALRWLRDTATRLGTDPRRIAVAGQSAGGALVAALVLRTVHQGGPDIAFQLLIDPVLDDRLETNSMCTFIDTPLWNRPAAELSWRYYLGAERGDVSPYAAPARAHRLAGLPPTYIGTSDQDPVRDEGILYALRLAEAGVSVELHHFPGTFHGSNVLAPDAAVSKRQRAELHAALRRALTRVP